MPLFAVFGALALLLFFSAGVDISSVAVSIYSVAASPLLVAIPLFTLAGYLFAHSKALGLEVRPEIRIQTKHSRFRVADIAVWRAPFAPRRGAATSPPFFVIEILFPEDRLVRVQPKVQEYLGMGVEFVWLLDPYERQALVYTPGEAGGAPADRLETGNPSLSIALDELWTALDV